MTDRHLSSLSKPAAPIGYALVRPLAVLLSCVAFPAAAYAPLLDPVALNIGLACQWQPQCMAGQKRAMKKSLKYVGKYHPPQWRIHLCNHNAARSLLRVDWIGFDHCVRNEVLSPPPPPRPVVKASAKRKQARPLKHLSRKKKAAIPRT